jgi:predicted transcriptional regulator
MESRILYLLGSGPMLYSQLVERVYAVNHQALYETVQQLLDQKKVRYQPGSFRLELVGKHTIARR